MEQIIRLRHPDSSDDLPDNDISVSWADWSLIVDKMSLLAVRST
jgi:hypothetical protein